VLAIVVTLWLLLVGVAAIAAAILYTGGPKPYGYHGLGEVMVLVFFGFVATAGSAFVQLEDIPDAAWWGSGVVGLLACALLLANNIRDIPTDVGAGKRTLAVRIGDRRARALYVATVLGGFVAVVPIGIDTPEAFLALAALPLAVAPVRRVITGKKPFDFVPALVATGRLELVVAVLLAVGLALS
jgi:1,4-dihydroxy-2-naphthoate polyprenyltransferase